MANSYNNPRSAQILIRGTNEVNTHYYLATSFLPLNKEYLDINTNEHQINTHTNWQRYRHTPKEGGNTLAGIRRK
jgi:hypothetical protein